MKNSLIHDAFASVRLRYSSASKPGFCNVVSAGDLVYGHAESGLPSCVEVGTSGASGLVLPAREPEVEAVSTWLVRSIVTASAVWVAVSLSLQFGGV